MQNDLHENKAGVCIVSFVAAKLHVSELDNEHSIGMLRLEKMYQCCIAARIRPRTLLWYQVPKVQARF